MLNDIESELGFNDPQYLELTPENIRAYDEQGLVVFKVSPISNIVTIDIDDNKGAQYRPLINSDIIHTIVVIDNLVTCSKSHNRHIFLKLSTPTKRERLALIAAACGSDIKRELLSLIRHEQNLDLSWCIVETKAEAARLRTWLAKDTLPGYSLEEVPVPPLPVAELFHVEADTEVCF